jgi:hypothetical protein
LASRSTRRRAKSWTFHSVADAKRSATGKFPGGVMSIDTLLSS